MEQVKKIPIILIIFILYSFKMNGAELLDTAKKSEVYFGDDLNIICSKPIKFKEKDDVLLLISHRALDSLAEFLKKFPEYDLIRVESHVTYAINKASGISFSQSRANKVAKYLVKKGVDCKRLMVVGYGTTHLGEEGILGDSIRFILLTDRGKVIYRGDFVWGGRPTASHCAPEPIQKKEESKKEAPKKKLLVPLKKANVNKTKGSRKK